MSVILVQVCEILLRCSLQYRQDVVMENFGLSVVHYSIARFSYLAMVGLLWWHESSLFYNFFVVCRRWLPSFLVPVILGRSCDAQYVIRLSLVVIRFHWLSSAVIDCHWLSWHWLAMVGNGFHWMSLVVIRLSSVVIHSLSARRALNHSTLGWWGGGERHLRFGVTKLVRYSLTWRLWSEPAS